MKLAFVYAGQGSQKVGMGRDFYDQYPEYRAVLDNAGLDFDLKTLTFEGPIEELSSDPLYPALHGGLRRGGHRPAVCPGHPPLRGGGPVPGGVLRPVCRRGAGAGRPC